MLNRLARYGFGAIALYLVVYNGSNAGKVIGAGAQGLAVDVKAFQGR